MKKAVSVLFTLAIILGVVSPAFAAEENDNVAKALALIEKTNKEIDIKIEKAVLEADGLQTDYLQDVRKIEVGDKIVKLDEEREKALQELHNAGNDLNKINKATEKLADIEKKKEEEQNRVSKKISEIQQELDEATASLVNAEDKDAKKLQEKIDKLTEKLNKRSELYAEKTARYTERLQKVIQRIYDEAIVMSQDTIAKVAEYGVIAECNWKLVRFADQWVWIDPVRVVKITR